MALVPHPPGRAPRSLLQLTSRTTLWFKMRRSRADAPRKSALRICRTETRLAHAPAALPTHLSPVILSSWADSL